MRILLQTALKLEFDAVKNYLSNVENVTHPMSGTRYEKGLYSFENVTVEILLSETGAGNSRAAEETGRAIEFFKPDFAFFVGVAGGLKDVKLADVVVSTKVIGYEVGKDDDEFKPRFDTFQSAYELEQVAKQVSRDDKWNKKLPEGENAVAFVQPIAAGEKVVSSEKSISFNYLRKYCSEAVAVGMEGSGFMTAARAYDVKATEVRGISDLINDKEAADASGSQPKAAQNAAAFTFSMIQLLIASKKDSKNLGDADTRKALLETLLELYPQGPEQDQIWKRAGGDISILINSSSRRSQWYDALEKLALGGGGKKITIDTLVASIKEDYPGHTL